MLFHQLSMGSRFGFGNKTRGWRGEGASTQVCFIDQARDGRKPLNTGMNNAWDEGRGNRDLLERWGEFKRQQRGERRRRALERVFCVVSSHVSTAGVKHAVYLVCKGFAVCCMLIRWCRVKVLTLSFISVHGSWNRPFLGTDMYKAPLLILHWHYRCLFVTSLWLFCASWS